jgi:hypothetical protein
MHADKGQRERPLSVIPLLLLYLLNGSACLVCPSRPTLSSVPGNDIDIRRQMAEYVLVTSTLTGSHRPGGVHRRAGLAPEDPQPQRTSRPSGIQPTKELTVMRSVLITDEDWTGSTSWKYLVKMMARSPGAGRYRATGMPDTTARS